MIRSILLVILSAVTSFSLAQSKEEKLDSLMNAYHAINKLNGSVLVIQKDKIWLNKGYGYRNIKDSVANDPGTVFQIGSVTKQFTAAIVLKLQEMKKLDVHDKISKYFPDFPKGDSIRIEHLLSHTSGIFNYTDDPVFMQTQASKPISKENMVKLITSKPLRFSPGTAWAYSNSNYVLLGYIIQQITGKPYEQVVRETILTPMHMNSTGFNFASLSDQNKAKGYKVISELGYEESTEFDSTVSYAAGGLYSTTLDLYKWQLLIERNMVIETSSYNQMITPNRNKYGYGVYIDSIYGKRLIAHGGLAFGFTSYLGNIPAEEICIVILNNVANTGIGQIAKDILSILYDKPYQIPVAKKAITLSSQVLTEYIGTYQITPDFSIEFTVEGIQLAAKVTGQKKVFLSAEKQDLFFIKGADVQVSFKRDESGKVNEIVLAEDGRVQPGKKIK